MRVLFATSEVAPLIKTGGLADVSGALPAALRAIGVDVRVLVPGYTPVLAQMPQHTVVARFTGLPGFPAARLLSGETENDVPLLVLDCPELYQREGGPYQDIDGQDWPDNALRFGLLSKVAAILGSSASPLDWHPDLVHCNDWQTGLAPAYLRFAHGVPSVMTVHNLAFQGIFPPETLHELHLPPSCFGIDGVEYYGNLSFLKAGLFYADHLTTVSPNYAREIQQEPLGFGMQGLLSLRRDSLTGILNGIDMHEWDPAKDAYLAHQYSVAHMVGKTTNKEALQRRMGLNLGAEVPLLGVVSRFTHQKGLDLLLEIVPRLVGFPVQLAMLGTGDAQLQNTARELLLRYPGQIAVHIGFSEELSHMIEAGADMFVMPSRFEPCGLNQLYSQRYGTPPIVHATGGLVDSVVDASAQTLKDATASGFVFSGMSADNLFGAIRRAVELYREAPKWKALCKNCMGKDFSWQRSAEAYRDVYLKVLKQLP
ncbi:glycogen synthase [Ferrigenium kumadai]|uniref:Glycogen synthase n=1 Tax=Ferrigenium kumadai TaxID=1682490 RepID=A0AAN1VZN8_9PROT|nr:glycogen synthase GlgA [Ferrigenium kumadai]BBI99575.1 glycogen synthase [Ferrigenium kumadai]